jgi:tetratricopeptide (TPR) repeat protein
MKAVSLQPKLGAIHYNLGVLLYRTGRRSEALRQWQAAAVLDDAMAVEQLGRCWWAEGRASEAMLCFNRALELSPALTTARLQLASLLCQTGRSRDALTHLRYVLKMDPEDKTAAAMLAKAEEEIKMTSGQ